MKARRTVLALSCIVLIAGCSGGEKTGGGVELGDGKNGPGSLFSSTPTPKAKPSAAKPTAVAPRQTKPAPVATQAAPKPPPSQKPPEAPVFKISINGDKSGKPIFDPPQAAVFSGTKVTWFNADTKPRGVTAGNGAFNSGPIAPGKTYVWIAGGGGMYAYSDSTRPYANGQLQVTGK